MPKRKYLRILEEFTFKYEDKKISISLVVLFKWFEQAFKNKIIGNQNNTVILVKILLESLVQELFCWILKK